MLNLFEPALNMHTSVLTISLFVFLSSIHLSHCLHTKDVPADDGDAQSGLKVTDPTDQNELDQNELGPNGDDSESDDENRVILDQESNVAGRCHSEP